MKKTSVRNKKPVGEETLRSEYRFDYSKSQPNRFAAKMSKGRGCCTGTRCRGNLRIIRSSQFVTLFLSMATPCLSASATLVSLYAN